MPILKKSKPPKKSFNEGVGSTLSRRLFLKGAAATSAVVATASMKSKKAHAEEGDHGVASGDPKPNAVTIWTRVPEQFQNTAGQSVSWEVASEQGFPIGSIVKSGAFITGPDHDYTVKLEVTGLSAFTQYYYRFRTETGYESVEGHTHTAPNEDDDPGEIRFAFVSCSHWGPHFNVYDAITNDDLHFCVHLGDTVYEHALGYRAKSLTDWRGVHKLHLTNAAFKEARRLFPWIFTWDDHEVYNNFNGGAPEEEVNSDDRGVQRNAYQAFMEFMPMDPAIELGTSEEGHPHLPINRRITYGKHVDLFALDGRQYKDGVLCGRDFALYACEELNDPERSLLGETQTQWLQEGLLEDRATWKILLNQTVMMALKLTNNMRPIMEPVMGDQLRMDSEGLILNADQWDGYPANRDQILNLFGENGLDNLIVITGDIHNCYAGELKHDFTKQRSDAVGIELVTGSVTSDGIAEIVGGYDLTNLVTKGLRPANPHLKWLDAVYHNYVRLQITGERAYATYVAVDTIESANYEAFDLQFFEIREGQNKLLFNP